MSTDPWHRIASTLTTQVLGHPLRYLPAVGSTQDVVQEAARAGQAEGLVVVAGQQTTGRGRSGRSWWSPPRSGLYASILLRPRLPAVHMAWVTMCLALGTAEALENLCGLRPQIKWPNDLEANGRKLAGILAEAAFSGDQMEYVVAGLGLNLALDLDQHPELVPVATSVQNEVGRPVEGWLLLPHILQRTEDHYLDLQRGVSPVSDWAARLVTLGQPVEATTSRGQVLTGIATQVEADGALCITLADGSEAVVRASDVTLRRT